MPALSRRMVARDSSEPDRVSSPLELLFDLTFVVAISQVAAQLAAAAEHGHELGALWPYCTVFFAIWWAWMNFTWFASAYDTDDVAYRLLTLLQMGGVLLLAAGVPAAFNGHPAAATLGYFVMRLGLVSQWSRAAIQNPDGRRTAVRYAIGYSIVQAAWLSRLALPAGGPKWIFIVLVIAELSIPLLAERTGMTTWHPHHIAERYGLFTLILLGESVLPAMASIQNAVRDGVTSGVIVIAVAGLLLLFALWWLYFSEPSGEGLERYRNRSFFWGYGHFFVFASLAAIGAGLEVAVVAVSDSNNHEMLSDRAGEYAVAAPVAVFLLFLWILHAPIVQAVVVPPLATITVAVIVLAVPLVGWGVGPSLALISIAAMILLAITLRPANRRGTKTTTAAAPSKNNDRAENS